MEQDTGWYYFGKCTPYPRQVKKGRLPQPPYKRFKTKKECQAYIDKHNTPAINPPWAAPAV